MNALLEKYGSFRRLIEAYWFRQLTSVEERALEDSTPKELMASFKPVTVERQARRDAMDPWSGYAD